MTVRLVRAPAVDPGPPHDETPPARWVCAFVNNMPDGAFDATERQYLDLLEAGSGDEVVEVRRFTMPGVPRGERTAARIAEEYLPFETVREGPPDLLIVTGSNPLAPRIEDEPYWEDLAALLSWGREHVPSMLLSCLSAHAALVVFDGIERTTLDTKCTGVFPQRALPHPLADGLGSPVVLPHSRLNTVERRRGGGRRVRGRPPVRRRRMERGHQGHRRFAGSSSSRVTPSTILPACSASTTVMRGGTCSTSATTCRASRCAVWPRATGSSSGSSTSGSSAERDPELVESFPFDEVGDRAEWPWRAAAVGLYTNWMAAVTKRSD